jgi:hypothetical protein
MLGAGPDFNKKDRTFSNQNEKSKQVFKAKQPFAKLGASPNDNKPRDKAQS